MTITLAEAAVPLTIVEKGQMECDIADCANIYGHPVVVDHPTLTPRQQLRQAAALCGWRETVAGLVVCPDCVNGPVGIVVPGWAQRWAPPSEIELQVIPPVMNGDTQQTLTIPAVVEPAGGHPYEKTPA
ncbi:hypothetical protein ACIBQ1_09550 [Nonomuraea sp. NPDC050153]|uniref:hypothetical protein n=1 Tax=Nonomuraea sp. NPDC050153 TaxID=3364359 RepID=UPI003793A9F8